MSSYGVGHNSIVRMAYARMSPIEQTGQTFEFFDDRREKSSYRLMRTSPAPGSGTSISTTLVEIVPGWS